MVEFLNMNSFLAQPAQHIKKFILSYLFFRTIAAAWCKILKKDCKHDILEALPCGTSFILFAENV